MDNSKRNRNQKFRIRYAEEFKHQVCREYLSGHYNKTELQDKYGIKGKSRLFTWLRELGYTKYIRENNIQIMKKYRSLKRQKLNEVPGQDQYLQNALQDARLQAAAYMKMIELAERHYKIKIRKNLSTK